MRVLFIVAMLFFSCAQAFAGGVLSQYSTIDALLAGVYDGRMTLGQLKDYGDLGLGTFNGLAGEMVFLDGVFYQVKADGKVYRPTPDVKTPFAAVVEFEPEDGFTLGEVRGMAALKKELLARMGSKNIFHAFKITGRFDYVRTRSVPAQKKPYPPLKEVVKHQPEFEFHDLDGTIIGFYCPAYVEKINVVGFHLHFLNKSRTGGGHLLDVRAKGLKVDADSVDTFTLMIPRDKAFARQDFTTSRVEELHGVEN